MSTPPPPPPNPTTTTADFYKSVARQRPRKHLHHPAIYQTLYNPQTQPSSTWAAFPPPPPPTQHSNLTAQHQQSAAGGVRGPNSDQNPYRPYAQTSHESVYLQQTLAILPTFATGVSLSAKTKVVAHEDNGLHNVREKSGDGSFVIISDRKVQVSEGTSLYAQCRSWLKNGCTLENQPQYVDCAKSLPKPLPASMVEVTKEDDTEMEEKMEDVEHLSAEELLQQHVKHAKKVRLRLRNQRLQRIERYKDRLALLLPPVVDQQPKSDPT